MYRSILILFTSLAFATLSHAQTTDEEAPQPAFPETEIFLFDYDAASPDDALSEGRNVTNRPGYDNQPFFTKESETFLYSRDDGQQTDVWEYTIGTDTHTQITATDKSEFSPTPSTDNQSIWMVFERNRSIWHLDRDSADAPSWLLETAGVDEPVGYFAYNDKTGDVLFWSRYGFNVALTHADKQGYHFISGHAVPATPYVIPGTDHFSFVHRQTNEQVWIKAFDPETKAVRPLTPIVGSNANYAWTPDGSILQIEDAKVYKWREDSDGWAKIADLKALGLKSANRIAVSPDNKRVAIVGLPLE
ncbi:MAG: hypothetical protein AAF296_05980 [Pseudomonadota bacterium]